MKQYTVTSGQTYNVTGDRQVSRVYSWEEEIVAPTDTNLVSPEVAQQIVDHIWAGEGREYPPKVIIKNRKNSRCADATRFELRFPLRRLYTWIIIHELAHSLTSNEDGASNHHNGWFVQTYIRLLAKYAGLDLLMLMHTATQQNIKIKR